MDIYTRDKVTFKKQDEIDVFESAIWTERYVGNGDFELLVPDNDDTKSKLFQGQILGCEGSDQPMILETREIKDGILKATGIALAQWTNNRIIRTTNDHSVKEWLITAQTPGQAIRTITTNFLMPSDYLDGTINIGIPTFQVTLMPVPGLITGSTYLTGTPTNFSVPFGPVYDAVKAIADSYDLGLRIVLSGAYDDYFILEFDVYKGTDRSSDQSVNPTIRFSAEMDSLTNIQDLESISDHKNWVYTFAPGLQALGPTAGWAWSYGPPDLSFDLRVEQVFEDDIDAATMPNVATLNTVLQEKANVELSNRKIAKLVDGEIVQTDEINYGVDYFLGDVVEVEGNTGILQKARITEYIRSKDSAGEKAYPTLSMID